MASTRLDSLMISCARGERAAFRSLYEEMSPQLFSLALRMLRNREAAEDALQDTFLTIWRKAPDFSPSLGSAAGWITVIIRNKCLDRLRRARPTVTDTEGGIDRLEDTAASAFEQTMLALDGRRVKLCIEELSLEQKQAINLAYFDGLTHEQLAERMARPLGTVKAWVRRALQQLKGCMDA